MCPVDRLRGARDVPGSAQAAGQLSPAARRPLSVVFSLASARPEPTICIERDPKLPTLDWTVSVSPQVIRMLEKVFIGNLLSYLAVLIHNFFLFNVNIEELQRPVLLN